jgi:hypothetical protein
MQQVLKAQTKKKRAEEEELSVIPSAKQSTQALVDGGDC